MSQILSCIDGLVHACAITVYAECARLTSSPDSMSQIKHLSVLNVQVGFLNKETRLIVFIFKN